MWIGVASQDKMEIRSCLPKLLLAQHKAVPYFIRNKLCKVIVDIGRQDWPMFYHDFFTNTLQVSLSDTISLHTCQVNKQRLSCLDKTSGTVFGKRLMDWFLFIALF